MRQNEQVKNELRTVIREELELYEKNRKIQSSMYSRICKEFSYTFSLYDYIDHIELACPDGTQVPHEERVCMGRNVRTAIGTLLRAVYGVRGVGWLPPEKEEDIFGFVNDVLVLMAKMKKGEGHAN